MVTDVKDEHPENALFGIDVAHPSSILYSPPTGPAVFNDGQPENTPSPTDITPSGIVTDVKDEHPEKAWLKINLQPLGILQFIISLFLARTKIRYGLPLLPK